MWKIYIKRFFTILSFIASLLALGAIIVIGIDAVKEINRIKSDPSASGIDYLGFQFYPMFMSLSSFVGLFCSGLSTKSFTFKIAKIMSFILLLLFGIILLVAFPMWSMG